MPSPRVKRFLYRAAGMVALVLLVTSAVLGAWYYRASRNCLPVTSGTVVIKGLGAEVTILRDPRGVPHIHALSAQDLYFAQGYVTAQDRLFQMDLMRRDAAGQLAEIFGEVAFERDRSQRTYGFRGVVEQAFQAMEPELKESLEAYAAGVNAYIDTRRGALPFEFRLLGYEPRPWSPLDTLLIGKSMALTLNNSWERDLMRKQFAAIDAETYRDLFVERSPYDVLLTGSDQNPARAMPAAAPAAQGAVARLSSTDFSRVPLAIPDDPKAEYVAGSNNWVVAGSHTASGKPLLANDPHLPIAVPPIWYATHLKCVEAGIDVAGVTFPGAAGITIGHNTRIAWGVTNFGPDVQDLYVEEFDESGYKYKAGNAWRDAIVRQETVAVRSSLFGGGVDERTVEVVSTHHGPIVRAAGAVRYALKWTALDPGSELPAFYYLNRAENWEQFRDALRKYPGPMQNFVYADVDGNIGYTGAGNVPIRSSGTGEVPCDAATGEGEWTGYVPFERLPALYNPANGYIATANQRITGSSIPEFYTHQWFPPFRARRIVDRLEGAAGLTGADMQSIQNDVYSYPDAIFAREILKMAEAGPGEAGDTSAEWAELRSRIAGFDGMLRVESSAAALLTTMRAEFTSRVLSAKLGTAAADYQWWNKGSFEAMLIEQRPRHWLPSEPGSWEGLILESYRAARTKLTARLGTDPSAWRYGDLNVFNFKHPLSRFPGASGVLNLPGRQLAGSGQTVRAIAVSGSWAPSVRIVTDLADFDRSTLVITSGQSGQHASAHYADQLDAWCAGESFEFPFSDDAVEKIATERLTLAPR